MKKKLGYVFGVIFLLLILTGALGIKWFNNMWFKETPNYLTYSYDSKPIDFIWAEETYEAYFEPHYAILIPVKIGDLPHKFYLQFDTGASTTLIYGNTLKSLEEAGVDVDNFIKDEVAYLNNLEMTFGDSKINMSSIEIFKNYGSSFDIMDTLSEVKIGTIGADFMDGKITMIDFAKNSIQLFSERPNWMNSETAFKPFSFKGRRFMLPAIVDGKGEDLFYDSGCSSFGLITTKNRYEKYTDKNTKEIAFNANRFGDPVFVHHKNSDEAIEIGGEIINLRRVSYINMYASFQRFMTPFTKIGGWLGNKPFMDKVLILDTQKEEFAILKNSSQIE